MRRSALSAMVPSIKANRVRGIAVTTAKRSPAIPDIPAVAEILPGFEAVTWADKACPELVEGSSAPTSRCPQEHTKRVRPPARFDPWRGRDA